MSRSVDLFISSSLPLDELAEVLRRRSSAQLIPTTDPERWRYVDGPVTAELFAHPYLDDGDLWLSRYRYVLSARMSSGVGPLDSIEVRSLRHLSQLLHDSESIPVLLVLDLQYRLDPQPPSGVFAPADEPPPSDAFSPPDEPVPPSDEPVPPSDEPALPSDVLAAPSAEPVLPSDEPVLPSDVLAARPPDVHELPDAFSSDAQMPPDEPPPDVLSPPDELPVDGLEGGGTEQAAGAERAVAVATSGRDRRRKR